MSTTHKRRWYQFSLLTLLVVVTLFTVGVGWVGSRMHWAWKNRERNVAAVEEAEAVAGIEKLGGWVHSEYAARRPATSLEVLFDDPGGPDDPVRVLEVTHVSFWNTNVTDASLEHVKSFGRLQILDLSGSSQITDAGLTHLSGLTNLRLLNLYDNTRVTDEGVEKLQQALPNCKIYH